jgi:hypothetical protein
MGSGTAGEEGSTNREDGECAWTLNKMQGSKTSRASVIPVSSDQTRSDTTEDLSRENEVAYTSALNLDLLTCMIRELHGVDGVNIKPMKLEGKDSALVANIPLHPRREQPGKIKSKMPPQVNNPQITSSKYTDKLMLQVVSFERVILEELQ